MYGSTSCVVVLDLLSHPMVWNNNNMISYLGFFDVPSLLSKGFPSHVDMLVFVVQRLYIPWTSSTVKESVFVQQHFFCTSRENTPEI